MAGVSGPINTLPGAGYRPPETECDDCVTALCNEIAGKRPEGAGEPWWEFPSLKEEYDRRKAELPRASIRIQGETDSFGCEFIDLCEEHHKAFREGAKKLYEEERPCDWCKKLGRLAPTRDYDEGSHGPVYEVCEPCRERQFQELQDELDYYRRGE